MGKTRVNCRMTAQYIHITSLTKIPYPPSVHVDENSFPDFLYFCRFSISLAKAGILRNATLEVLQHYPEVIIWDSHLALTHKYQDICRTPPRPRSTGLANPHLHQLVQRGCRLGNLRDWACQDNVHPGYQVNMQWALTLVNYVCHKDSARNMWLCGHVMPWNLSTNGCPVICLEQFCRNLNKLSVRRLDRFISAHFSLQRWLRQCYGSTSVSHVMFSRL